MLRSSTSTLATTDKSLAKLFSFDYAKAETEFNRKGKNLGGPSRALGELGEQLVSHILQVPRSENRWDETGDMVDAKGRSVEVKTQNRFRRFHDYADCNLDLFSIRWAQEGQIHYTNFQKCLNVDRLFFVEYRPISGLPGSKTPYVTDWHDWINVWECIDRKTGAGRYRVGNPPNAKWMYSWPIKEMALVWEMHDPEAASVFRKYSSSGNSLD